MPINTKRGGDEAAGLAKRLRKDPHHGISHQPTPSAVPSLPVAATPPTNVLQPPQPPGAAATVVTAAAAPKTTTAAPPKKAGAGNAGKKSGAGAAKPRRKSNVVDDTTETAIAEWGRMLGVLKKFMTQHENAFPSSKDTVVREDASGDHDNIGLWCIAQREKRTGKRPGTLSADQEAKLDAIGFDWDAGSSEWDRMFGVLKQWISKHNGAYPKVKDTVPKADGSDKIDHLGTWCVTQRQTKKKKAKNKALLSEERVEKLNEIGFDWEPLANEWNRMYAVLKTWLAGHSNSFPKAKDAVPRAAGSDQIDHIGTWCVTQRQTKTKKRKGKLTDEQIQLLDDIGFVWNPSKKAVSKAPEPAAPPAL